MKEYEETKPLKLEGPCKSISELRTYVKDAEKNKWHTVDPNYQIIKELVELISCPIGMDDNPSICSASTCLVCTQDRVKYLLRK